MATLQEVESAFLRADQAGDTEAAAALAGEVRRLRGETGKAGAGGNFLAGAIRGAGSIGATLLTPIDAAARTVGVQNDFIGRTDRRQAMDQALAGLGADPESLAFGVGKLGTEIAGTFGAGGALARGASMLPGAARAAPVIDAIRSAGFTAGGAKGAAGGWARLLGGAVSGGGSAALVNPDGALVGAGIGAALPPVVQGLGAAGRVVGSALRSPQKKGGAEIAKALDLNDPIAIQAAIAKLKAAQSLVPGSVPTAAQALGTPQAGILERVMSDSKGGVALKQQFDAQNAARLAALDAVAPTAPTGYASARQDAGNAISRYAAAEEGMSRKAASRMYAEIDPFLTSETMLPVGAMKDQAEKFVGKGAFGKTQDPWDAVRAATALSKPAQAKQAEAPARWWRQAKTPSEEVVPKGAKWDEVMRLRESLNTQWQEAKDFGNKQSAAALAAQKQALDSAIEESLPAEMLGRWKEANASWGVLEGRFHTGPQASIFQTRNGIPTVEGGEVAAKFWGDRPGLAGDVKSFRRLIDDNPSMLGQFRSLITTEGASTATAGGNLSSKFVRWVENTLPGLDEAFDPAEVEKLKRIAEDIKRADKAAGAGMARGSNTYQNAQNALSLGMLDSPLFQSLAVRAPLPVAMPIQWMRDAARQAKAERMTGLLSDAGATADALMAGAMHPPGAGILGSPMAAGLLLRSAPVMAGDR